MSKQLRNIAIIAHVDHGKTTLVDQLLRHANDVDQRIAIPNRVMDSNDLERERGITILSKNTAINWGEYRINLVDTPGHADFGGEVERILSMVDCVLLLVDAVEGPMPQTRFVTRKAFDHNLRPIVVINKIDRPQARPDWVLDQTFDLFDRLGATEEQLDFPVVYASALNGLSGMTADKMNKDMDAIFQTIVDFCPPPDVDREGPFQMQVTSLDYSNYVGSIAIGRISRGAVTRNMPIRLVDSDGKERNEKVSQILGFFGLERIEVDRAEAGDIVAIAGIERPRISQTLCDPEHVEAMPSLTVDEPMVNMVFETNDSPFAGREGKYVTSRQLRDRLERETLHNVALRVEDTDSPEAFSVSGRGELHLSVLLETMRREGFELAVSRPRVIQKEIDGVMNEPVERLVVDVEAEHQGGVIEALGDKGGQLLDLQPDSRGRVRLEYLMPARGLIGFQTDFRTMTSGSGLLHHVFDHYAPIKADAGSERNYGVLISNSTGKALGFALFNLQERGRLLIGPSTQVYEGQIVGRNRRENDLTVNPIKGKQLTNVRASGTDEKIRLTPPLDLSLEQALEFISDDELVEITPVEIRLRKRHLKEFERKRASRSA